MVRPDGRLKILDFGLAKANPLADGRLSGNDEPAMISRTLTAMEPLTRAGTVVGTVPYMSPEQLLGKQVDHRSDLFSLGVVLYEMLTGVHPFLGDSNLDIISRILRERPQPASQLRPETPVALANVVEKCLAKEPVQRYMTASELQRNLAEVELSNRTRPLSHPESRRRRHSAT